MTTSNQGRIGYQSGETPRNNVICYLEEHAANYPERVALHWTRPGVRAAWNGTHGQALAHDGIHFGEFLRRVNRFARGLLDLGVSKGDRVIIFLPMGVDMYTSMFAVQRIGAMAVFLDSWARSHHLGASAKCVDPKAMISFREAFALAEAVPEFASMKLRIINGPGFEPAKHHARFEDLVQSPGEAPMAAVSSEFTALITFTTGSSGVPKGANRTHRFLSAQHEALSKVIPYTSSDRDLPAFPIFALNNLASGVSTVMPALDLARPSNQDSALLVSQLLSEHVTCTTLSPSMFNGVAMHCAQFGVNLTGLRRVVTGGAPVSRDNVRDFKAIAPYAQIWVLYGSTEVEPMAHIEGNDMINERVPSDPELVEKGVNVGEVSEDLEAKFIRIHRGPIDLAVTPWSQLEQPRGEVGEFIVTGDHVCRDYYNNPEAFKTTKILDESGRVWHRTGDLAYLDAHGDLWIVGRVHNVIERAGRYHFPVPAEILLKRMEFVERGAYLGMPDTSLGERGAVAVQLKEGATDRALAVSHIQSIFAKNEIPVDSIYFVDTIPMDPRHHSKVEYGVLREQVIKNQIPDSVSRPGA